MTKRNLIRDLGLVTGLVLAFAGSAHAAPEGKATKGKPAYKLSDSERFAVQGDQRSASARSEGGGNCDLPRPKLSLAPNERAIELRRLSFNPRTCRALYERGVPPKGSEDLRPAKSTSSGSDKEAARSGGVSAQANGYRYSGYSRAWYVDPRVNKVVTDVRSGADWNRSGRCIGANNVWFLNRADTRTGWREVSHRFAFQNKRCDKVISSTSTHFLDNYFTGCGTGPESVDTYFRSVQFIGFPSGSITGSRGSRNEPSCKNGLIAYYALYRR